MDIANVNSKCRHDLSFRNTRVLSDDNLEESNQTFKISLFKVFSMESIN